MKPGSLVEVVVDWTETRAQHGYKYPDKGDILTVKAFHYREGGHVDLSFEEGHFGPDGKLYISTVKEVQTAQEGDKALQNVLDQLMKK